VPFACLSVEELTLLIQRQLDGLCYKDGVFDVSWEVHLLHDIRASSG